MTNKTESFLFIHSARGGEVPLPVRFPVEFDLFQKMYF